VDNILGWVGFENRDNVLGDKIADSCFEFFLPLQEENLGKILRQFHTSISLSKIQLFLEGCAN